MSLVLASKWVERFREDSRPDARTVRSWVKHGMVPGEIIGTMTYVDLEAYERDKAKSAPRQLKEGSVYRM